MSVLVKLVMSNFNHTVWKSSNKSHFFLLDDFSNINKLFYKDSTILFFDRNNKQVKMSLSWKRNDIHLFCGLALYSPVLCFVIHYEEFVIWIMLSKMIMRLVFLFCREKGEEIFIHDSSMADEIHSRKLSFSLLGQESTMTFIDSVIWLYALWCKMNVHTKDGPNLFRCHNSCRIVTTYMLFAGYIFF